MNLEQAIDKLKPYASKFPEEALDTIRANWAEAEKTMLDEIDWRLEHAWEGDRSALFTYAIHLCAEMKTAAAFPRFLALCRLPNAALDYILGDIITETMPEMLARTCDGRIADLKALVESSEVNEFARSSALRALLALVCDKEWSRDEMARYCMDLLDHRLERIPTYIWDSVIDVAANLGAKEALPLIRRAFEAGLADETFNDFEYVEDHLLDNFKRPVSENNIDRQKFTTTEDARGFFVGNWDEVADGGDNDPGLLDILLDYRPDRFVEPGTPGIGRNDPCPCGSGRKYKKCCMDKNRIAPSEPDFAPANEGRFGEINNWMRAGYLHQKQRNARKTFLCWKNCWMRLLPHIPPGIQNPDADEWPAEAALYQPLAIWLRDFHLLIMEQARWNFKIIEFGLDYFRQIEDLFPKWSSDILLCAAEDRARLLAMRGRSKNAVAEVERLIAAHPGEAHICVALADMLSWNAREYNLKCDIGRAKELLRRAIKISSDGEAAACLQDLEALET